MLATNDLRALCTNILEWMEISNQMQDNEAVMALVCLDSDKYKLSLDTK